MGLLGLLELLEFIGFIELQKMQAHSCKLLFTDDCSLITDNYLFT